MPAVTCPANVTAEASGPSGALVSYSPAVCSDAVSTPSVSYSQGSGTVFPLGSTAVTATATNEAGNVASCQFTVTVRDTTAPVLTCPASLSVETPSSAGAIVSYEPATATEAVSMATITYSRPSGSLFAPGVTLVAVTATDQASNSSQCTFTVTVTVTEVAPDGGRDGGGSPGADAGTDGGSSSGADGGQPAADGGGGGTDGGGSEVDGGTPGLDGGSGNPEEPAGCGCGSTSDGAQGASSMLMWLALLGLIARRASAARTSP